MNKREKGDYFKLLEQSGEPLHVMLEAAFSLGEANVMEGGSRTHCDDDLDHLPILADPVWEESLQDDVDSASDVLRWVAASRFDCPDLLDVCLAMIWRPRATDRYLASILGTTRSTVARRKSRIMRRWPELWRFLQANPAMSAAQKDRRSREAFANVRNMDRGQTRLPI